MTSKDFHTPFSYENGKPEGCNELLDWLSGKLKSYQVGSDEHTLAAIAMLSLTRYINYNVGHKHDEIMLSIGQYYAIEKQVTSDIKMISEMR